MARPRHIDQDAILLAAEKIVIRDGVGRLTIEAVAIEAGISKASVLYDFKTKDALIRELIASRIGQYRRKYNEAIERVGDRPDAFIRGAIEMARERSDDERALASGLCDIVVRSPDARSPVKDLIQDNLDRVKASPHPRGLQLAIFALSGLQENERLIGQVFSED